MKQSKPKKVTSLYKRLIKINEEISALSNIFDEREELLTLIFSLEAGPQEMKVNDQLKTLEVVEQKGHYVFNKPFRLSEKKAV